MQYRLRTLLILLALLPPVLAGAWYLFANQMNPLAMPGIVIPAAAILSSFLSASFVGLLFHDSGFTRRTVLAATMASAILIVGFMFGAPETLKFLITRIPPYFPLLTQPRGDWGDLVAVFLIYCQLFAVLAGLVFGFIFAFIGFIWGLRSAGSAGDTKPVPSPAPSFAPALVQALIGMMWLIPFLHAVRKLIYYWDWTSYADSNIAFPTLTLSSVFLLHAYGLLRRQLWARSVAFLTAIPSAVVFLFGMTGAFPILEAAILGKGNGYALMIAPIIIAWLLMGLTFAGSQCFVAYATVKWTRDSGRTPLSRWSAVELCGCVLAASLILLAVVGDVSVSRALQAYNEITLWDVLARSAANAVMY